MRAVRNAAVSATMDLYERGREAEVVQDQHEAGRLYQRWTNAEPQTLPALSRLGDLDLPDSQTPGLSWVAQPGIAMPLWQSA